MEVNNCDIKHLDSNALLPPRKRLLAGLKRQSCDLNGPAPSASRIVETGYDTRRNNLLKVSMNYSDDPNDDIVETSRSAAIEAVKVAEAARANAEIKAAKAARAMAVAKIALDLVATLSEAAKREEKSVRKSKMKKHITVEALYNKNKWNASSGIKDEELARKLHQTINSSPRTPKCTSGSDTKIQKNKKLKSSSSSGGNTIQTVVPPVEGNDPSAGTVKPASEAVIKEVDMITVDLSEHVQKTSTGPPKYRELDVPPADKSTESLDISGKKRGRMKQKKLPLSICNFKDQANPKDDHLQVQPTQQSDNNIAVEPSFPMDKPAKSTFAIEGTSTWKCQAFNTPNCVTQNKVMQS